MVSERGTVTYVTLPQRLFTGINGLSRTTVCKGVVTIADQAIVSAVNFLTGVIIGRTCSKEEFGLYTLGFSIMLFMVNMHGALIASPYMVYSPRLAGRELTVYTTNTLIHQLCLSALSVAALFIGSKLLAGGYGPAGLAPVVLTLAVVIAAIISREYARQLSFAWLNTRVAFLVDACVAITQLGGLLFLLSMGELSACRAYYVSGAACGLAAVGWLYKQRNRFTLSAAGVLADFRRNWLLGRWNLAGGLANLAGFQAYPWILTYFHGTAATGSLAACLGVVFIANPILIGMGNFLGPKITHAFAQGGPAAVHRVMTKAVLVFLGIMSCFFLVMLFFGGTILRLIYGGKYTSLGMVVAVLTLSQLVEVVSSPLVCSLFSMGWPDAGFKSYLIGMLVTFTVGLWLAGSYGIKGVAFSLLAANTAAAVYRWVAYRRLVERLKTGAAV